MDRRAAILGLTVVMLAFAVGSDEDAVLAPEDLLGCGFEKRYEHDLAQLIEVESLQGERRLGTHRLQLATQEVAGRSRSLAIFLAPPDQRGMKLLTIESEERRADHFLYLPMLRKVQRIYGGTRREAFLGSEFSYEDMERQRASDFEVLSMVPDEFEGEAVERLRVRPHYDSAYAFSDYLIAPSDCLILEIRHYKEIDSPVFKTISSSRAHLEVIEGVHIVTRSEARNLESNRRTVIRFVGTEIDPGYARRYFEPSILERISGLPGLPR